MRYCCSGQRVGVLVGCRSSNERTAIQGLKARLLLLRLRPKPIGA